MMPRHINPTSSDRTATAPYNFVPLPNRVFTVEDGIEVDGQKIKPWEQQDRFIPGTYSGWIDLEIEALTPIYIRGAATRKEDGEWDGREARVRPEPYMLPDGRPAIPGSSLRGMVRTLVEILAFAKIPPVSKAKLFYRDVSQGRIGEIYRKNFIEELGQISRGKDISSGHFVCNQAPGYRSRVCAGFIDARSKEIRKCEIARVEHNLIKKVFNQPVLDGRGPQAIPNQKIQYQKVLVSLDPKPENYFYKANNRHSHFYLQFRKVHDMLITNDQNDKQEWMKKGYREGTLVITGGMPNKHLEFVFLDINSYERIKIPEDVWDSFNHDNQITQWQERAFPLNGPRSKLRKRAGGLSHGQPVFYLLDEFQKSKKNPDGLVFLGRASMFRLPYDLSPFDLVPEEIRNAPLDLAEAMFGKVDEDEKWAIKGRVFFEDAVAVEDGQGLLEGKIVPKILSSPKPTSYQNYLTQDGTKDQHHLTSYFREDSTTIRGHKLYWHRWCEEKGLLEVREGKDHDEILKNLLSEHPQDKYKQHTVIQPVKSGLYFRGRIRFENLTDLELGALLSALELPEHCAHKLGMGKPLGLGSVRIKPRLRLIDRMKRYQSWSAKGDHEEDGRRFREVFEKAILDHAQKTHETFVSHEKTFDTIARIDALFRILQWKNRPELSKTAYMGLERFRQRPVLPTPHQVLGIPEPDWPEDSPKAGEIKNNKFSNKFSKKNKKY